MTLMSLETGVVWAYGGEFFVRDGALKRRYRRCLDSTKCAERKAGPLQALAFEMSH
jgi:hypothetical protein